MKILFLLIALSVFLVSCGEKKLSDEEIQKKADALYEKVLEAEQREDFLSVVKITAEVLNYCDQLSQGNSYKKEIAFGANQRMGIAKYYLKEYDDAVIYLERALAVDIEEKESVLNQKLDMWVGLADTYEQLGNKENRDYYLNLAEKRIHQLENGENRNNAHILDRLYFFYITKNNVLQNENHSEEALKHLLKLKLYFDQAKAFENPQYPAILFQIAKIYYKRHIYHEAALFFKQTLNNQLLQTRFSTVPYIYLFHIYISESSFDKALHFSKTLLAAIDQFPSTQENKKDKAIILFCIGKIYSFQKQEGESEKYEKMATELTPLPVLMELYNSVP